MKQKFNYQPQEIFLREALSASTQFHLAHVNCLIMASSIMLPPAMAAMLILAKNIAAELAANIEIEKVLWIFYIKPSLLNQRICRTDIANHYYILISRTTDTLTLEIFKYYGSR